MTLVGSFLNYLLCSYKRYTSFAFRGFSALQLP